MSNSRFKKHFVGLAVFGLVLSGCIVFQKVTYRMHPSDKEMIANFHKHRCAFDTLINMAREDHQIRAIYSSEVFLTNYRIWPTNCSTCFSRERWNDYQAVIAGLGDWELYHLSQQPGMVHLPVSFESTEPDENLEYLASEKGYAYSQNEPKGLVESLDGMGFETKGTFYKEIGGGWYLYHEWGVGKPE